MSFFPAMIVALALTGGSVLLALSAQVTQAKNGDSIWDGVYTQDQASRGRASFETNCSYCHHEQNDPEGPALVGADFIDRWREDNLDSLFTFIKTKMPRSAPGSLSESTYVDIVAYLLEANELPKGLTELNADILRRILIVQKDGPKELPSNAQVLAVGCLTAAGNEWVLTRAIEPVRNRRLEESTPEELQSSAGIPLGNQTLRLRNVDDLQSFKPELKSHKLQVKGILVRQAAGNSISVTSLQTIAESCDE